MSAAPSPVIRATRLRKSFGPHAVVREVSFEVAAGETLVLLGPSGCGKTTLLKLLNRLIEPDGGTVEINGRDVLAQRPEVLRRGMGYVIQQVGLLPHYTVAENIAVVPRLLGHAPAAIARRTAALLTRLHLPPDRYAGQYPHQLSGGQQQRVGLARALAADPPIVLRVLPGVARRRQVQAGEQRLGAGRNGVRGVAQQARHHGHVFGHGVVRQQAHLLNNVADAAPQHGGGLGHHVAAVDFHGAGIGLNQTVE